MKNALLGGLLGLLLAVVAQADVLRLKEDHPHTHVVVKGDTLWGISNMFLQDPWLWPELWHINPQIDNPHLIFPGDVLRLVYLDGKPRLIVDRNRDIKLGPTLRSEPLDQAIPTIPLEVVNAFLSRSRILDQDQLQRAPYVLTGREGHLIAGAGDEIYARGSFDQSLESYGIYRRGEPLIDPDTRELLGIQAMDIGTAKRLALDGDVATLALNRTTEEVRRGDRLLPEEARRIEANFFPDVPADAIEGYLLAVENGVSQIGHMDVVIINRGQREGLLPGHLLAVYKAGEQVQDPVTNEVIKTPDFRAGLLMIFRTFDKVSYGLVLRAERPLKTMDRVRTP